MSEVHSLSKIVLSDLPQSGYIRQAQLIPDILPFSAATLWRLVKTKKFPAPIKLSERVTAWKVEAVRKWLDDLDNSEAA